MFASLMREIVAALRGDAQPRHAELPMLTQSIRHKWGEGGGCQMHNTIQLGPRGRVVNERRYTDDDGFDVVELEYELDPFVSD